MKLKYISSALAIILATSCDSDHKPDWDEPASSEVSVVSTSVADGSTVSSTLPTIDVTYSAPIAVNSLVNVTLNDANVSATVNSENPSVLTVTLPDLTEATKYALSIPARCSRNQYPQLRTGSQHQFHN